MQRSVLTSSTVSNNGIANYSHQNNISTEELQRLLLPITLPPNHSRATFRNWGKTYRCAPRTVFIPENEEQCRFIIELAHRERTTVRACGAGHSPSDLACTSGYLLRTDKLDKVIEINVPENYVIAQAGISLHVLHERLREHGLAMSNVGSISDQSLGGVITTATHGSGVNYAVIPSHVLELTLLIADGSSVTCSLSERQDLFLATLSGLGTTGLVLNVKLSVEPAFNLHEIRNIVSFEDGLKQFESITNSAEHVRIWWFPRQRVWRVMASSRTNQVIP
ncbi:hypothetical protein Clacol_008260 [Clathrus columnatus]|uniref:D-arabinono-1,4-lactone oxidase n=1 Tax=Clathrus columnatus TaxID=1419009 RepID=A0AAV5ALM9_9AGAM|nr:hypothetical protein Clacol_008260 [Clathrus columnatus]